jgi:hypothetical protein
MKKQIQKYCLNGQTKKGFLLIEGLTVLFIFALVTVTFYSVFSIGIRYIQDAKNRLGALAIANEKIEIIRNLQYDSIGTDEGAIEGDIPQDQDVLENTRQYHIHTDVSYIDDPYDGLAYSDTAWFEDYKRVTITVSWINGGGMEEVELISRFVPPGKEVPHIGDGILSINIFSDQPGGVGIPSSRVDIYNPDTGIDTFGTTDSTGNVTFMGSRVSDSIQKYQLTVTKNGYETVHTMSPYPTTAYEPIDVHASVVTGSMNVKNLVQNELASIKISSVNHLDEPIAGVSFDLVGGRRLGTDITTLPVTPIYNFNENGTTDSAGEKLYSSISPGEYTFALTGSALSDYEIISMNPPTPFSLLSSDGTLNVSLKLADKDVTSFLITVLDVSNDAPIAGAKVKLTNSSLNYEKELDAAGDGRVFFPDSSDPLLPETYHVKITASEFSDSEFDITINANELKLETKKLTAS